MRIELESLKRKLLDLDHEATYMAYRTDDGLTRPELAELQNRIEGRDWPLHAFTMIGEERLDDLRHCVERIVEDDVQGDLIEAGVWRGGACMWMRAILNELGDARTVYVADSFAGFRPVHPDPWEVSLSRYKVLSVPLEQVRAGFELFGLTEGVQFVPGYFEQSLPQLVGHRWALIRCDADTFSATCATLENLEPGLSPGGFVIVDDYRIIAAVSHAVDLYRAQRSITSPLETCDSWNAVRWRKGEHG